MKYISIEGVDNLSFDFARMLLLICNKNLNNKLKNDSIITIKIKSLGKKITEKLDERVVIKVKKNSDIGIRCPTNITKKNGELCYQLLPKEISKDIDGEDIIYYLITQLNDKLQNK